MSSTSYSMPNFYKNDHNALNFNLEFAQVTCATAHKRMLHIQSTRLHCPCALQLSRAMPTQAPSPCPLVDVCLCPVAHLPQKPMCDAPHVFHVLNRVLRKPWQLGRLSRPCAPFREKKGQGHSFVFTSITAYM
jgi:hypothetical protein